MIRFEGKMYNKRQEAILAFIKSHKSTTRQKVQNYIEQLFDKTSKITLLRDLELLLNDGLIIKSGNARATEYHPAISSELLETIDIETYFAQEADSRKLKSEKFNFEIWSLLTNLLTEKEKSDFQQLNQKYLLNKAKLTPMILHKELERLTIELAWKSSKIEGNTYTLLDTERLLKDNVSAKGKSKAETQMILNHKKALDYLIDRPEYYKELSLSKIEDIHRLLVDGLDVSLGIRRNVVGIVGTNYKPIDNAFQIKEALQELIKIINQTENPLEKALLAVLMIAYIQPFEDGNKRTSRILGNALLLANNYCPLSYRSVDEVEYKKAIILFYEQNNASYFKQLFLEQFKQAVEKYF
ncbi:MAG: Fic family protein [Alphaproteobacteria bacterium]|nr:Fic family protein [Alphaproteobacteria bacterium]